MSDASEIRGLLTAAEQDQLDGFDVFAEIGSTNTWLLEQPAPPHGRFRAVVADHQTAGRGRGGNTWISSPCSGVCLSVSATVTRRTSELSSLTLAVGVAIADYLRSIGGEKIALKWPNDIIVNDRKLGGILTETRSQGRDRCMIVIGVGLNRVLPEEVGREAAVWKNGVAALSECMADLPGRNALAAGIIRALLACVTRFDDRGFAAYQADWARYDWLKGKNISAESHSSPMHGTAAGVDSDGALLIRTGKRTERLTSGSVTVLAGAAAIA